ncbi:MAG: hypothetical protein CM1200mP4_2230 [Rhodospirillaceae bacterium]|nr:MAG: hypothetical protein CM1200mP4_2230 [Rhodospirillaceae bacterium]
MGQAGAFAWAWPWPQKKKRVLLVTGDGELLMSLGILATIANQGPENLVLLVMDNESYAETGGQPTATAGPTDLEQVARGCGIKETATFQNEEETEEIRKMVYGRAGPVFMNIKVFAKPPDLVFSPIHLMGLPLLIGFESLSYRTSLVIIIGINFKTLVC